MNIKLKTFCIALSLWLLGCAPLGAAAVSTSEIAASAPTAEIQSPATAAIVIAVYCVLIVFASLSGGWLATMIELTHTRMQLIVSFVGGLMLGVGFFHMIPHSLQETGSIDQSMLWVMVGLVVMFLLLRMFHFHQHGVAETDESHEEHQHHAHHAHQPPTDHHDHHTHHHPSGPHKLSWTGVALGLGVHTLIDGMALAASVQADARYSGTNWTLGIGTFAAIFLHKPLDAVSITSLMTASGWSAGWRNAINACFALMCPLGALLFWLGIERFADVQHLIVGCALAFSAGVFICISLSDLLPEIEFHTHDRFKLTVVLLTGIGVAYAIGFLEPGHVHNHGTSVIRGN